MHKQRGRSSCRRGVTMTEYVLIGALISIAAIAVLSSVGPRLGNWFRTLSPGGTTETQQIVVLRVELHAGRSESENREQAASRALEQLLDVLSKADLHADAYVDDPDFGD